MFIVVWCFDRGNTKEGETKTQRSGDVTGQGRVSFPNVPTPPPDAVNNNNNNNRNKRSHWTSLNGGRIASRRYARKAWE